MFRALFVASSVDASVLKWESPKQIFFFVCGNVHKFDFFLY